MCVYNQTIEGETINEVEGLVLHEASTSYMINGETAALERVSDELISSVVEDSSVEISPESLDITSGDSMITLEEDEMTVTSMIVDLN